MQLVNIHNIGKKVFLFARNDNQELSITEDDSFYPYYFEPLDSGDYTAYDGTKLKKMIVNNPRDIKKVASNRSYSKDVDFLKNYMLDKIPSLEKCPIKYFFIDIEVLATEIPNVKTANCPVSCISVYNSFTDSVQTWWLKDYKGTVLQQEKRLLQDFIQYMHEEKPDLWLSWNVDFDYQYLYHRVPDFAKRISAVDQQRKGKVEKDKDEEADFEFIDFPVGMCILDYLLFFKKIKMKEPSYTLDAISQKYLKEKAWGNSNFSVLTDDIKEKNINDVIRMKKLEEKFKIIKYFDEIRRLTKATWEELYYNSLIIETLLLDEAKQKNIVLPNKPQRIKGAVKKTFEGATRDVARTGAMFGIGKFDLTSAYPNMVVNFCLDSTNITDGEEGTYVNGVGFQQDAEALLPTVVRKILQLKDHLKEEIGKLKLGSEEYEITKVKYDAIKGVVNSTFGVMGFESFRLYDARIASSITYLVRELLMYVKDKVEAMGYKIVYWDTDGLFIETTEDLSDELNIFIQEWARENYRKESISIKFDYEGYFDRLFILAKCRYIGTRVTKKGIEEEIKGVEVKRSSSSKFEGKYQKELIDRILNKESKETVLQWINSEKERIKTLPIEEVGFPCKLSTKVYDNEPIFRRAFNNTNLIKAFTVNVGELFWYIYTEARIKDENGKPMNVFAFSTEDKTVVNQHRIDWSEVIRRNIDMKTDAVFVAMNWDTLELSDSGQMQF